MPTGKECLSSGNNNVFSEREESYLRTSLLPMGAACLEPRYQPKEDCIMSTKNGVLKTKLGQNNKPRNDYHDEAEDIGDEEIGIARRICPMVL